MELVSPVQLDVLNAATLTLELASAVCLDTTLTRSKTPASNACKPTASVARTSVARSAETVI